MAVLVNSKQFRNPISGSFTGSFVGNLTGTSSIALTSSYADNFTVGNTLTAQRIVVQTISSSVVFSSGSNRFGNDITNTQSFTGSVGITGSLTTAGNILPTLGATYNIGSGGAPYKDGVFSNLLYTPTLYGYNAGLNLGRNGVTGMRIHSSTNNIQLQDGGTFTDNGYRLQVNGSGSLSGSLFVSGSSVFSGSVNISGSLTTTGTITAQTLVVQTITSSIEFVTGSTRNGSLLSNTHQFTGSVGITGSLSVDGASQGFIFTDYTTTTGFALYPKVTPSSTNYLLRSDSNNIVLNAPNGGIFFTLANNSVGRFHGSTGNLTLQNAGTYTDAGFRLDVSGSTRLNGTATIVSASLDYQQNLAVATGSFQTITSVATGSFRSAFFDYVTYSGSIVRAGTIVSTWSGSVTEFYENFTEDLGGSTSVVNIRTAISGSNIQLQAGISGSAWSVRSLVRLL